MTERKRASDRRESERESARARERRGERGRARERERGREGGRAKERGRQAGREGEREEQAVISSMPLPMSTRKKTHHEHASIDTNRQSVRVEKRCSASRSERGGTRGKRSGGRGSRCRSARRWSRRSRNRSVAGERVLEPILACCARNSGHTRVWG